MTCPQSKYIVEVEKMLMITMAVELIMMLAMAMTISMRMMMRIMLMVTIKPGLASDLESAVGSDVAWGKVRLSNTLPIQWKILAFPIQWKF